MATPLTTPEAALEAERSSSRRSIRDAIAHAPRWVWVLAFYVAMALVTIGRHALSHPRTICACVGTEDPSLFMWGLSWWPHAISHSINPFVSHEIWAPSGIDTAKATLMPTAAIATTPFTVLFGPIFSYNVLSILSPALSAFTAYLLCRRLVGREVSAVVGGYLFGFSSYEFAQLTGHLNLTLVFLIPVIVHVSLRRVDREISRRTYICVMALLLVLQAGLSTELLAECVAFGAVLLVASRFIAHEPQSSRMGGLVGETICAGLLALVVAAPFFYYALFSGGFPAGSPIFWDVYALDLLNPIFPTGITWLGHSTFQTLSVTFVGGGLTGQDGYLSIPLILAFLAFALGAERRRPLARLLVVAACVTFVAALGAHMHIAGYQTITLPLNWTKELPLFNDIIPSRMVLFTTLAVSIGVAAWSAKRTGHALGRWVVVLIAVVITFPNVTMALYGVPPRNPKFFSTAMYKRYLTHGETVLILPYGHNDVSMLWQAETGFYFYMPEGYVGAFTPPSFASSIVATRLLENVPPPGPELGTFIRQHNVSHVVVDEAEAGPWPGLLAQLGLPSRSVGGVLLYGVPGGPADHGNS